MTAGLEGILTELKAKLRKAFPDARIDDSDVEGVALALQRREPAHDGSEAKANRTALEQYRAQLDAFAESAAPAGLDAHGVSRVARRADGLGYYWAIAEHIRHGDDPQRFDPFEGKLAMVRVSLPAREPRRFATRIGTVEPGDHLIATVHEANDKYAETLTYALQRVDLITPPRQLLRFGAISVLLGYKDKGGLPTCYILEAGTAIGQPKVLYLGRTLDAKINRRTGYKPTLFSCSDNAYAGTLAVEGHEPKTLKIKARDIIGNTSAAPYITVNVSFEKQLGSNIDSIWPGWLIARAALIVERREAAGLKNTCEAT